MDHGGNPEAAANDKLHYLPWPQRTRGQHADGHRPINDPSHLKLRLLVSRGIGRKRKRAGTTSLVVCCVGGGGSWEFLL